MVQGRGLAQGAGLPAAEAWPWTGTEQSDKSVKRDTGRQHGVLPRSHPARPVCLGLACYAALLARSQSAALHSPRPSRCYAAAKNSVAASTSCRLCPGSVKLWSAPSMVTSLLPWIAPSKRWPSFTSITLSAVPAPGGVGRELRQEGEGRMRQTRLRVGIVGTQTCLRCWSRRRRCRRPRPPRQCAWRGAAPRHGARPPATPAGAAHRAR